MKTPIAERYQKYEALLETLEVATRRKPSAGISDAAWRFVQDFEPAAPFARAFLVETWNLLWGNLGTLDFDRAHQPGGGNANRAERALGERGRRVLMTLFFDVDFRGAGRPPGHVEEEIAEQIRTLWAEARAKLKAARRELSRDSDSPTLQRVVKHYCPELSSSDLRTLVRKLWPLDGRPAPALDAGADLILGARHRITPRRVRAVRSAQRRSSA
jgi:hypothetical protein